MAMPPAVEKLINQVEPGMHVFSVCVRSRVIRVVTDAAYCKFRVEQLHVTGGTPVNPIAHWRALSSHQSTVPGDSLKPAIDAAKKAEDKLLAELQKRVAKPPPAIFDLRKSS